MLGGHPMCDDIHIFVCHMARFTCCLKASSQRGSFPIVLHFCSANLQSERGLYTDHPLKLVSQNFPNLWFQ